MGKKVLVLAGSARKQGNSSLMADEFIRGAKEAGHDAEKIYLTDKSVKGCLGCGACQRNGGQCVQKDDMNEIYEKVKNADVLVFAFPVYFYTWNGQMKTVLDRLYAVEPLLTNKTFYMLASGQAPTEEYMTTMIDSFRRYIGCFRAGGNAEGGFVFGYGTDKPGDVVGTVAMEQAFELGRSIR